ncbi:MAG TPA: response regulator [Terriglobales bacterium]|nr:response regulator [Terriglobales bacterium]
MTNGAKTPGTILLVEDDPGDAALMRRGFEKAGVLNPIQHMSNGDKALAYLAGVSEYADRNAYPLPVLILLDLKLPGMTGLELLRWLRTQRDLRRIPAVVLTMNEQPETINAAYDAGANSYLVKPGDHKEIVGMINMIQQYWLQLNEPPQLVMRAQSPE